MSDTNYHFENDEVLDVATQLHCATQHWRPTMANMSEDERIVREAWKTVSYCSREETNSCCPPSVFIAPFDRGEWAASFCEETKEAVWAAARKFTEDRMDIIKIHSHGIQVLKLFASSILERNYKSDDWLADYEAIQGILAREEQALEALKEGMKP